MAFATPQNDSSASKLSKAVLAALSLSSALYDERVKAEVADASAAVEFLTRSKRSHIAIGLSAVCAAS